MKGRELIKKVFEGEKRERGGDIKLEKEISGIKKKEDTVRKQREVK